MEGKDVVARLLWVTHRGHERMEQSLREREREREGRATRARIPLPK